MMLILIILGLFMDWVKVLFTMNMQISFLSPPFDPAIFYLKSVAPAHISLKKIFSSVYPFIILQIIALSLLIAFPKIALFLL